MMMALYCSPDYQTSLRIGLSVQGKKFKIDWIDQVIWWWPSWISNQNNFSYFWSTSHLDTSNEVWVNCLFGSRGKVQNRFSTRLLGQPSWISDQNDYIYFPILPIKFWVNGPFYSGGEVQNRFSRWQLWGPSCISHRSDFSYFWSTSHLDESSQVSSQLAFQFRRRSQK